MQLKYITGTQKTVHTSQSDSVNVQTTKTVSFTEMCHRREVWKYDKRKSTATLMNLITIRVECHGYIRR